MTTFTREGKQDAWKGHAGDWTEVCVNDVHLGSHSYFPRAPQSSPLWQSARDVSSEGVSVVTAQLLGALPYEADRTRAPLSWGTVGSPLLAITPDTLLPPVLSSQASQYFSIPAPGRSIC